jgi:hypothetical protein
VAGCELVSLLFLPPLRLSKRVKFKPSCHVFSDNIGELTSIFKDGSAAARRPAVTHAVAPPDANVKRGVER